MPSEAQSQEPRDRGPQPPVTRAGRSALLAKVAASSPAPEKRPRGRPRKDGSTGRSAPSSPPPPPPPKSRKGRSRGRAQVEDATEKKTPQKTEEKEVKTIGRRSSASRRKSNVNPEPDPEPSKDRLTPEPEPDPDHAPAQSLLDPLVPQPCPQEAPCPRDEDRTSSATDFPLPPLATSPIPKDTLPIPSPTLASSPGEESRVSPRPPSPDRSPVCSLVSSPKPTSDPKEEDHPRPSQSPTPMEVDSSPITVPIEMSGGRVSPIEQGPALSPCPSPLASPCPRLSFSPGEDEDSLSPLFQRSLSEDSGGSPTPSLGHTKKRLKQCAFCYRGDVPPLGQGHLVVFGPTPGYIPLHILNRRASSDRDNDCHDHCYRGSQAPLTCSSPEQCEEESSSEFLEQLGPIGLPHDINVQSLFDPTGQCCAHFQCAAWSEGVCRGEGQSLLYVDKAIDSGSTQVCVFCHRLGASLRCREAGCGWSYHFPCASAAGAHQDWNQQHTFCTRHTQTVPSQCVLCSGVGDISGLLMCCCCGNHYHGSCLDPPLAPSPLRRAGWQCPQCRVCQSCRLRGDDSVLLACKRCDKAYHTHCLTPALEYIPSIGWSCKNCRVCSRCGVTSSGQWANHPFLCESCDPAVPCPLCGHTPNLYSPQDYLTCICCYRCVHAECIVLAGEGRAGSEGYICSSCRPQEELIRDTPISHNHILAPPLSLRQTQPLSIVHPLLPAHPESPPTCPTPRSPVQPICFDPVKSPTQANCTTSQKSPIPFHPDPTELQQSPTFLHPESTVPQQSPTLLYPGSGTLQQSPTSSHPGQDVLQQRPTSSHPGSTELQEIQTSLYPGSTELQQSPTSSHLGPTELQQSPTSSHPGTTELQQSPTSLHDGPSELQPNLTSSHPGPTELQQSPTSSHPGTTELQQSPTSLQDDLSDLQQNLTSSHPGPTELQQSQTSSHPGPTELQQSPTSSHLGTTELQQSPTSLHDDLSDLQQNLTSSHPGPTELQQSQTSSHPGPTELQQSPTSSHLGTTELQQSPTSLHDDLSDLQQNLTSSHPGPTELQQSQTSSHPSPTELQQSPTSSHLGTTELQQSPTSLHDDLSDLQQNLTSSHPGPTELQQSQTSSHPGPMELQQSSTSSHLGPTELQQSPTSSHPGTTERQQSPTSLHDDPPELQQNLTSLYPGPTELQQSPTSSHPGPTEPEQRPTPSHPGPTEFQQSPTSTHPNTTELQQSPTSSYPDATELQQSPTSSHPDTTELQQSPTSSHSDATELQQSPTSSHPDATELKQRPTSHPDATELKQNPMPLHTGSSELQQSCTSLQPGPTELQQCPTSLQPGSTELQQNPSHPDTRQLQNSPKPLHRSSEVFQEISVLQSPTQVSSTESLGQHCSHQHDSTEERQNTFQTINDREDEVMATESHRSLTQYIPMTFSPTHSLQSLTRVQSDSAEPQHCPSPHSPAQDITVQDITTQPQLSRPCSPTTVIIAPSQFSSMPHSPAQVISSLPTKDAEPTLDQEGLELSVPTQQSNPAHLPSGTSQNIVSLDHELLLPVYCRPTRIAKSHHTLLMSISAPCSPSPLTVRPAQCSLSQPASPVQALSTQPFRLTQLSLTSFQPTSPTQPGVTHQCISHISPTDLNSMEGSSGQCSPNPMDETVEQSPVPEPEPSSTPPISHGTATQLLAQHGPVHSSTVSPKHTSSPHSPATPTPESLVHVSTSMEHSSLACSPHDDEMKGTRPPANSIHERASHDSPSCCIEANEIEASPIHNQANPNNASPAYISKRSASPTSTFQASTSPIAMETNPVHVSPLALEAASVSFTASTSVQPAIPPSPTASSPVQPASPSSMLASSSIQPPSPLSQTTSLQVQPASPSSSTARSSVEPASLSSILACSSKQPPSPSSLITSLPVQPASPSSVVTCSSVQPLSPSELLAHGVHPSSQYDKMELDDSPSHCLQTQAIPIHVNSTDTSPLHTSPLHVSASVNSSHCSLSEVTHMHINAGASPVHDKASCSIHIAPVQTSHLPGTASFSPPHCRLINDSPVSSSVSHILSTITSDLSGQTGSTCVSITDVSVIHSLPRSSPAGHASPVQVPTTASCAHSDSIPTQTPSQAKTTYSSFANATVSCAGSPHSPAQASEIHCSPKCSPHQDLAPINEIHPGLTVAQLDSTSSNLEGEVVSNAIPPSTDQGELGQFNPPDIFLGVCQTLASSLHDGNSSQTSWNHASHTPASSLLAQNSSAVESQESTDPASPLNQRPVSSVDASPSPVHASPTQVNTTMPSSISHTSATPASLSHVSFSKISSPQTSPSHACLASSVHSSPVYSPVHLVQTHASPVYATGTPASYVQLWDSSCPSSPDSGPGSSCASSCIPCHVENTPIEMEPVGAVDVILAEEQKKTEQRMTEEEEEEVEERREEEMEGDIQLRTEEEREEPDQTTDKSVESIEGVIEKQEKEEEHGSSEKEDSNCPPSGVHTALVPPVAILTGHCHFPPHTAPTASPISQQPTAASPQPTSPRDASPPLPSSILSSPSSSASPPPTPHAPRAGSLEVSSSPPHKTALLSHFSTQAPPPSSPTLPSAHLEDSSQKDEFPNEEETETEKVVEPDNTYRQDIHSLPDDSQTQNLFEPVAMAEATKDTYHSHIESSERLVEEEMIQVSLPESAEHTSDMATPQAVIAGQQPMRENQEDQVEEEKAIKSDDQLRARELGDEEKFDEKQEEKSEAEEELVSPVLELDPSLDMEVMELMASTSPSPSLLHLSSPSPPPLLRRGKGRTLRPPPSSSRPLDDLSIRLRQSPFSTEASPETSPTRAPVTPPPLSPSSPPHRTDSSPRESPPLTKPQAPPTSVVLFTPKIGMGKPAISKRKFSPGRARVKQGSWWSTHRAVSPPSSSQDSTGEGGWDSPKPGPPDSPMWSMRVGRGSGFPGRRRSRGGGVGGGRGGRGRSRLKTQDSLSVSPGSVFVESFQLKEEEENSMHNTVVMFSTCDLFTLRQDMCVVCGSFGQGAEGRLLACAQCGQCYHPYCVNVKITRVVLTKGWRCLECTVCEACGEASDPGRLLLCDDCDISYHTYCLDPPLHTVPKGAWKCKWCVWCVQCGSASPGLRCDWQNNYSRCGPCASLSRCPLCQRHYAQNELILQCQQCDRWVHAMCQGLSTEDEVEVAADEGFDCSLCRTHCHSTFGRSDSLDSPYMAQIISRVRQPDIKTYTQDGVCLTELGLSHLQCLVEPLTSPRRYRRCKPKLKLRIINQNSVSVLQTLPDPEPHTGQDHAQGDLECDMKSDSSPERDHIHDDDIKEPEITDGNKKRKRKPYRPGIGGFMVRQRGGKAGPGRIKLCRKDSTEMLIVRDDDAEGAMETVPPADQIMEKVKKRYRKKKTKLEEAFPSYLQEAFFGRDLLDRSRQVDRRAGQVTAAVSQQLSVRVDNKTPAPGLHDSSSMGQPVSIMATNTTKKPETLPMLEETLVDLSDVLNTDPHILATGHTGQFQVERSPSPFAGLDISSMADDPSLTSELTGSSGRGQRAAQEEPLDAILSPELDKMVTDGAILSKLYKIPELEGKDVEEVFTAVLSPNSSNNQQEQSQHTHTAAGSKTHITAPGVFPRLPVMNGLMGATTHFPSTPMVSGRTHAPAGFRILPPEGTTPAPSEATRLASGSQAAGEVEQDVMSTAQRSMLKWEKEETLGELATVAPVLYCNTNFPQLREQYPDWSTRVKQIAKLWRKASSQDRAPYVQKARDNRAAQRISKVQLSNDPLKRHQPSQQLAGPYNPVSMETEVMFKDPLRPKESEQEQEWKYRQQMRQKSKQLAKIEATQKLEQVKNEQLQQQRQQQQLLASQHLCGGVSPETGNQSPMMAAQQAADGGNSSPLQHRDGLARPHHHLQHSSGLADDVFLRPQAPPPSGFSSLPHSPHSSSPHHQPPSSPQMFSPPTSRPSSPWDPYGKVAGTPRPASSQSGGPPVQQQRRNSLSASPAHDALGSPAPSPDSKASDPTRPLGPQAGLQQGRVGMMSPPTGSAPDHLSRHTGIRATETYQRTPHNNSNTRVTLSEPYGRAGEVVQGGVFKAPMPPQQQPHQEVFGSTGGGRRDLTRPTDFPLSQSQDSPFPSSPLSGLGSPHRSPYAQAPGTPRPDYSQQIPDPFAQQSPLTSRPSPDPYSNPQTPGTPCPHSDPSYLTTPPALRLDQYSQQSVNRRPSPSHPNLDPYGSNPGTPRPSVTDRFPRSPGSQRSVDPYTQPAGTPRPSSDPYAQQPSTPRPQKAPEPFGQAPAESGCGPSTPPFIPTHHQYVYFSAQQSPGRQQQQQQHQDSFPRTPSSQIQKHPRMSEEGGFSNRASHDPFDHGHMTHGPPHTDKTSANEMAALGGAVLDGPICMLPQLGDSEEKLRQRQRLRQLILRQQQQKNALRQEKGLQEPASGPTVNLAAPPGPGPAPAIATSHHWSQDNTSPAATPQADLFGRPPPPYPGTVRPGLAVGAPSGAPRFPGGFPGEQQRAFPPSEAPFPRQSLPRELGVQATSLRFGVPPGPPAGVPDPFLRTPQGSVAGSGFNTSEGVPGQMRMPIVEFTGIRHLTAANTHPHMMAGIPQPFPPRSLPIQQHSIMGQPYIELRHRAPENRLRLPFPLPDAPNPEGPLLHSRDPTPQPPQPRPTHGARMDEVTLGQQMAMASGVEQLSQQEQQHHLAHRASLAHGSESTLPGGDGIEEHLEGDDSAVKDLEDVEVKDLVDLNLNLDAEDGKEDLDLGPNDLHLDDFLLSGKFDLIAYADPELNLEDKKDMFNEELDLGEPMEEKEAGERRDKGSNGGERVGGSRKPDSHTNPQGQVKGNIKDGIKTECKDGPPTDQHSSPHPGSVTISKPPPGDPGPSGAEAEDSTQTASSSLLIKEKLEDSDSASRALPTHQAQEQAPSSGIALKVQPPMTTGQPSIFQQRPFGPSPSALPTPQPQTHPVPSHSSHPPQGQPAPPNPMSLHPAQPHLLLNPQTQPPHPQTSAQNQNQVQNPNKLRPLLLEEQPLLLQDLLDQERQEQQQQKQMQSLIRQKSTTETPFPDIADFDSISDPIMKAKMVALKGINKVMTQGSLGLNSMVINRFHQAPVAQGSEGTPLTPHLPGQDGKLNPQLVRPNPPSFGPGFTNESQCRQYEEWLGETQQLLQMQQRLLEEQIAAHRKTKKALSAKQRTAKKAGRAFSEEDAAQLRYITEQQGTVQKQLEQIRKQQKDHAELIEDYKNKQQQQRALQQQPQPPMISTSVPPMPQTVLSQPLTPMQPQPGGSTPTSVPNIPPGWAPEGGPLGSMGQRLPPHLAPQMPPVLPNAPQPSTHTPPAMIPSLSAPSVGFTSAPHGSAGGSNGATGDPGMAGNRAAPTPKVKFDDNNPFSEGFQERERRERLREQQERQRVQLMQEVERHRALQQRLELEQKGLLGASMGPGVGVAATPNTGALSGSRVGPTPAPGAGVVGPTRSAPAPSGDILSQMPFFSSELPQDFLQSPPASRAPPQHQGQAGAPFPQQAILHQVFVGGPHPPQGLMPGVTAERGRILPDHGVPIDVATCNLQTRPRHSGPTGPSVQGQVRQAGVTGMTSHPGSQSHSFGPDSSSSSTPLPPSFPSSSPGGPASLVQLYSDIIPDDKPKKKRNNRKRDGDDTTGGVRTPLSSHSDDITAPPTPAFSDTSCSTPTQGTMDHSDLSLPPSSYLSALAPSSELERQLSADSAAQDIVSAMGVESQRGPWSRAPLEVKEEREERFACGGGVVKMEEGGSQAFSSSSPLHGGGKEGDGGKELLRHLLKDKTSPATTPPPTSQAPPACRQLSTDSLQSEEEEGPGSFGNMVMDSPDQDLLEASGKKKIQRYKRLPRPEKDRGPPKCKKRRREEEKTLHSSSSSSSDPLMTQLRQLSVLPLMEPVLGVDLSLFRPYGSSSLHRDSRLTGTFGNACLEGVTDYYSQLIYKQNNLSNPPTPPASLPPTPPPVARQKLVNGFATTEELASKDIADQEVKGVSGLKQNGEELLMLNHASKMVDVPASLPTPPHNNQEELRVQDSSERNSPDSFVPSSSPESVADMEVSRYPDLSFIKLEPPSPCSSPTIPIMPCTWGKGSAIKQEIKAEPNQQGPPSCSSTDLVTIAITLNPLAAQNVPGVMAAVAELLRVPLPVNYQLSQPAGPSGPERSSLALLAGVRVPLPQGSAGRQQRALPAAGTTTGVRMEYIQHGSSAAARPQCCSHCKVLLGNGIRIVKDLKEEGQSRPGPSLVFCSPNCSALYTSNQSKRAGNKSVVPVLPIERGAEGSPASRVQHQYTNNMSSIAVHSLPHTPPSAPSTTSTSPPLAFPPASVITMETKPRMDSLKVKVKLKPHPRAVPGGEDLLPSRHGKRMKGCRWQRWSISVTLTRGPCIPNEAVSMPTEEELDVLLKKLGACLRPDPLLKDQRQCCFCHQLGDGQTDGPARLLNLDLDLWVHLNCALWSSEVYETQAGALINVELALRRGLTLRCAHCQQTGATSGCNRLRCTNTYHFTCALQAHCTFFKDKTMLCHLHKPRMVTCGDKFSTGSPSSMSTSDSVAATSDPYDSELRCFAVFRRVYVQRDDARQIAAVVQRGEQQHTFRVGSLLFCAVGRLLPRQMKTFHNDAAIFPVGYRANRIYWSMRHSNRRCKYMCYIEEKDSQALFKVKVEEKGHDDLILTGPTPKAVWDQILELVSQIRASSGTLKLFPVYLKGEDLFGLTSSAVARIIESLPGVEACERYIFRYGRNPLMEWPLAFNPTGSARSEPKAYQAKRPYLLTSIAPRCQGSVGSIVGLVPGVIALSPGEMVAGAHQGRHSKSSQYRRMKAEWKSNVYLARSRIQGLGLYAARDIEKCTMVIEYIGTIIRSEVANRKERLYESQNRGVYMFRIDNDFVIDATITGGPARYINHSCSPNCITEVVSVEKENKIIISSCRRIQRGEELSYDYKFDLEDDQHKIPCHCGAVNCRKWMN